MKLICDTNIWYHLGANSELLEKVKDQPICPTMANIFELSKTKNVIHAEDQVRAALQSMFHFNRNVICEPPFVYLAGISNDIEFDIQAEVGTYLRFAELFASGEKIRENKFAEYEEYINKISDALKQASDFINKTIAERKQEISDRRAHKIKDTVPYTAGFINFMVKVVTQHQYNTDQLDLSQVELLIRTLGKFLHNMERSKTKLQPNDWYDFLQLGYVQPGDKYWTKEKKWLSLIQEAGMEDYLYEGPL